jgi:hypothetical protein
MNSIPLLENYIPYLILSSYLIVLLIGYLIGMRSYASIGVNNTEQKSFVSKKFDNSITKISIDDTKYVTDMDVSGLEKKYESLGEKVNSQENIDNAVNKLKNLKG